MRLLSMFLDFLKKENTNSNNDIDVNVNYQIASTCLKAIGYTSELQKNIDSIATMVSSIDNNIIINDKYFYEESAFYQMTIIEAQERFKIINESIKVISKDHTLKSHIDFNEIIRLLRIACIDISKERILKSGLKISLSDSEIEMFLVERYHYYEAAQLEHLSCPEILDSSVNSTGLPPRNHPLKVYLGLIADNIAESLGISSGNNISLALLETALLAKYTGALDGASNFLSHLTSQD